MAEISKAYRIAAALIALFFLPPAVAPENAVSAAAWGTSYAATRLVTPNGDGKNDTFIFRCYNTRDSLTTGTIYDLNGGRAFGMRLKSVSGFYYTLEWNPNSGGRAPGGVYIYQVVFGDEMYNGTVVVIR